MLARLTPGVCFLQAMLGGNDHPGAADVKKILGSGAWLQLGRGGGQCCCCRCSCMPQRAAASRATLHTHPALNTVPTAPASLHSSGSGRIPLHGEHTQLSSSRGSRLSHTHTHMHSSAAAGAHKQLTHPMPAAAPPPPCAVGVEADAADVERLLKELEGKDIKELIAAGEWASREKGSTCTRVWGVVCGDVAMWGAQGGCHVLVWLVWSMWRVGME